MTAPVTVSKPRIAVVIVILKQPQGRGDIGVEPADPRAMVALPSNRSRFKRPGA